MKNTITNPCLAGLAIASLAIPEQPALAYCPLDQDQTSFNRCLRQQQQQRDIEFRMQQLERKQRQQQRNNFYGW